MTPDPHPLASRLVGSAQWLHSYPAHLSRTWTLASGESLSVRPGRHDDGELEEFVRALSLESRYQRMLSGGTKVTPEWIAAMTHGLVSTTTCAGCFLRFGRRKSRSSSCRIDGTDHRSGVGAWGYQERNRYSRSPSIHRTTSRRSHSRTRHHAGGNRIARP